MTLFMTWCPWAASLILAAVPPGDSQEGPDADPNEPRITVEQWPPQEDLRELEPGFDPLHPVPPRPLDRTPLRISSNNLLHGLFGLLTLESAETIEEGRFDVGVYEDFSSGKLDVVNPDYFFRYEASLLETNLVARVGFYNDWELIGGLDVSNLLEETDDIILARRGKIIIAEGSRSTAVGDLRLAAKKRLLSIGAHGSAGVVLGVKIPISRSNEDLLSSGAVDLAGSLLFTQDLGPFTFHLNAGAIIPGDIQLFEEEVETRNAVTFGLAAVYAFAPWGTLHAQVQGNQSVFEDSSDSIAILDETVLTAHVGTKLRVGSYFLDLSIGSGFNDRSSDRILTIGFGLPL